jgi:NAD(P)-dependent dehydrogenase (short-subunit alcohol dehydrogenase family)
VKRNNRTNRKQTKAKGPRWRKSKPEGNQSLWRLCLLLGAMTTTQTSTTIMTLMNTQNQKSIFITGSSSGLGRATAKLFASKGWKVIATMRNPEKETELNNISGVTLMALDITNPSQITSVVEAVMASGGVDVVFNNAGYGLSGPLEGLTDEQIMRMVNTNMLGAIRTTKAFVPYFREKRAGLFINTTSIGGLMTVPFNSIYHATKWALEGWSESMAFELNQFGIGMKTVSPGGMKTDFFTRSFDTGRHPAYDELVDRVMSKITDPKQMETYSSPGQIAEVVYEAATDGKKQLRYIAGADAKATYAMRLQMGDEAFRNAINQQFFGQ